MNPEWQKIDCKYCDNVATYSDIGKDNWTLAKSCIGCYVCPDCFQIDIDVNKAKR